MTIDLLCRVGVALYGPQWQRELARQLDIDERRMRRMIAGDSPIPPGIAMDLSRLLDDRGGEIMTLHRALAPHVR